MSRSTVGCATRCATRTNSPRKRKTGADSAPVFLASTLQAHLPSARLAERRVRALRTRGQHAGAIGLDGPPASRAGERARGSDVAAAEGDGRVVELQQGAAQELPHPLGVLGGEFPGGPQPAACHIERAVEPGERGVPRLREDLMFAPVEAYS